MYMTHTDVEPCKLKRTVHTMTVWDFNIRLTSRSHQGRKTTRHGWKAIKDDFRYEETNRVGGQNRSNPPDIPEDVFEWVKDQVRDMVKVWVPR